MADPFVAEIRIVPSNFAPSGWAFCDGQLLPIAQNTALFSLLGTTYGGNGTSTFALPDLQGRAPMHPGTGPGLTRRDLGESGGTASVTLLSSEMPAHNHGLGAAASVADTATPGPGTSLARSSGGALYQDSADTELATTAVATAGGGQPHNNMQPYLTMNFIIALQGVFPLRP